MFGYSNAFFGVMRRTRGSNFFTAQSQWNVDPMNGTGPSTQVLDPTKGNLYKIEYKSAGFGSTSFYVGNASNSEFTLVHQLAYANSNTIVDINNTSFPLWMENVNTTNTVNTTLGTSWMRGFVEGRRSFQARPINTYANVKTWPSFNAPDNISFFVLRVKQTINGFQNQSFITLKHLSLTSTKVSPIVKFMMYRNPVGDRAAVWSDVSTNGMVEADTTIRTIVSGTLIGSYYCYRTDQVPLVRSNIRLFPGDTVAVAFSTGSQGATYNYGATLVWEEGV
jgi:hypothetical protein